MLVATILQGKGAVVHTIGPDEPVAMAVDRLTEHRIGALVVSVDGKTVGGIISERDIVRGLSTKGATLLDEPVGSVMTSAVVTCTPEDTGHAVLSAMT
jgi:CBS domain-containing protein